MKNTGALLKAKRESSNLSLSEVALATKINPKVLAAIESGETSSLPAKTILKGFVRSYAQFLKMDLEEVMRSFSEETGGAPAPVERPVEASKTETSGSARRRVNEEGSSGMRTAAVVVIVLLIGLIIGVRELIEKYQRETVVEQTADQKLTPLPAAPEKPDDVAKPETDAKAEVTVKEADAKPEVAKIDAAKTEAAKTEKPKIELDTTPIDLTNAQFGKAITPPNSSVQVRAIAVPETLKAPEKKEEPKVVEKPAEPVKPTEAFKIAEPAKPADVPAPAAALKSVKSEIILEALDKVDVKFQVKGETKKVSLAPNQVHTIHADQPLAIDFSDGGAVNVIVNGRERGPAGDLGQPKTIKVP